MPRQDRYLDKLAQVPMFQACSKKDIAAVGRVGDVVPFKAGDVLVREGDRGREFFVLVDGKTRVYRGGVSLAELGPGDYFGELALLDPGPRDASVVASTDGEALVIHQPEFHALLVDVPTLTNKLLVGMARRLHDADRRPVR